MYYTGQVDVQSQLPNGLGSLRDDTNGRMYEGHWHFGKLVQEHTDQEELEDDCYEGEQQCLPCQQHSTNELCQDFSRYATVHHQDDSGSSFDNSVAETIHDDGEEEDDDYSSWARSSTSSFTSSSSSTGRRVTFDKLQEYERYVEQCDEHGDYYCEDEVEEEEEELSSSQNILSEDGKKIRWMLDP